MKWTLWNRETILVSLDRWRFVVVCTRSTLSLQRWAELQENGEVEKNGKFFHPTRATHWTNRDEIRHKRRPWVYSSTPNLPGSVTGCGYESFPKIPKLVILVWLCMVSGYITACTVVQAVVKATSQSNGKGQILTPPGLRNPWTDFDETRNI